MSIRAMQAVWQHSQQSGGALVLMLAIADNAHDDGDGAYPSIERLAEKARMTPRNVNLLLTQLVAAGELLIRRNAGPKGVNVYRLILPGLATPETITDENITGEESTPENISPVKTLQGEKSGSEGVKNPVRGGEKSGTKGVKPASPKPSLEPSLKPSEEPSVIPRVRAAPKPADIAGKKREPDPFWDGLVEGMGWEPHTTNERKRFGRAVAEVKLSGAAASEIPRRCANYRRRWPNLDLTPEALIKHWSLLEQGSPDAAVPAWKRVKVWD